MDAAFEQIKQFGASADETTRRKLVDNLRTLADSMENKFVTIHRLGHLNLQQGFVEVGLDLGIYKILVEANGPKTFQAVAEATGTDPALMRRILRYYGTLNIVTPVSKDSYTASNVTRNLAEAVTVAALRHYYGICKGQYSITPSFLKENGYKNPTDETRTAFHEGWNTTVTPFEWMSTQPDALDHFHTYMSLRRQSEVSWLSVFPAAEEMEGLADPERPLYVNVGGGIGHQCLQFVETFPDVPGRIILQDLEAPIANALPVPKMERMVHNFFEPQPVKGAKFYFMRGVPHNHPPHKVKTLFANIKEAMVEDSVLLVDETVLPETGIGFIAASIDLTMLGAFASMERTEAEWRELFESVGLDMVKTYPYNPSDHETVMEVRLPKSS